MADAYQAELLITSSLPFKELAQVAKAALDQQEIEGVAIRHVSSNEFTDRYKFGAASGAPVVALASLKSGDVSFSEDGSYLTGSADRLAQGSRDSTSNMLWFMWKVRKLNKAMARFPAAVSALQEAVTRADPNATFVTSPD